MDLSKRSLGQWGEDRAARHLCRLGYRILARNWRPPERELSGELDLVAADGDVVVVCELKTRRHGRHGGAAGAVNPAKQERIRALAASWLRQHPQAVEGGLRFDVITIEGVALRHWESAF